MSGKENRSTGTSKKRWTASTRKLRRLQTLRQWCAKSAERSKPLFFLEMAPKKILRSAAGRATCETKDYGTQLLRAQCYPGLRPQHARAEERRCCGHTTTTGCGWRLDERDDGSMKTLRMNDTFPPSVGEPFVGNHETLVDGWQREVSSSEWMTLSWMHDSDRSQRPGSLFVTKLFPFSFPVGDESSSQSECGNIQEYSVEYYQSHIPLLWIYIMFCRIWRTQLN